MITVKNEHDFVIEFQVFDKNLGYIGKREIKPGETAQYEADDVFYVKLVKND